VVVWISAHLEALLIGMLVGVFIVSVIFAVLQQSLKKELSLHVSEATQAKVQLNFTEVKMSERTAELDQFKAKNSQLQQQLSDALSRAAGFQAQLKQLDELHLKLAERDQQLSAMRTSLSENESKMADVLARSESDAKHHLEQVAMLQENKEQLKKEFSYLANEIFEQKQKRFSEQSKESMTAMLEPFNQQIQQFRKRVDDIHTQDTEGRSQLITQLNTLKDMNSQLNKQADDLTKALKGDKKIQGNWGELQIERILESSGLQKGREYEREENFKDDQGKNFRPDFTIHLPDGKHVIIDSKVSLNAYQIAVAAEDDQVRETALREHIGAIRQHIKSLSQKNYPKLEGMKAPDFVLMFMPIESAFVAAFEAEPNLFNEAFEQHIVVVTPTTLLATLRTVANIWVLERQNENAKELFKLAGKIFDKFVIFSEKMERLGTQMNTAEKTYSDAMSSLSEGRGSMVSYVKRLKEVGAPSNKKLPDSMSASDLLSETDAADT
jgi:DNA recombination protein RmuC